MTHPTDMHVPGLAALGDARQHIQPWIHRTPILTSRQLDERAQASLFFKCENLQKTGAFKIRGATNAVLSLSEIEAQAGVATHSSGNHGAALALAARNRGIRARVVMPSDASLAKKQAVSHYGGEIVECEPGTPAREARLAELEAESSAHVVHPYHDSRVIAGQATVALEILEQVDKLDTLVVPVGGGGLIAGCAIAIKQQYPHIEVIGAEPSGADDTYRSFYGGSLVPVIQPNTIADGLRASLGQLNYDIIHQYVDDILTVDESLIIEAMQWQWTRLKTLVEPSGAVSYAATLAYPARFHGKRVALVISGGNLDLNALPW